jgi:methylthioribose-1-phosphate isomerase
MDTLKWKNRTVVFIDQRVLPLKEEYITCKTYEEVAAAIKDMVVRGAPAIGVSAAYGIALGVFSLNKIDDHKFNEICNYIALSRPTAVNLFWSVERMKKKFYEVKNKTLDEIKELMLEEAHHMYEEDILINKAIGDNGSSLIKDGDNILTHCNAGALATAGYGTALGVIRSAHFQGKKIHVYVDETRPFLQGARLTSWELMQENIPATLITDNMSAYFMSKSKIDLIIVGADRVAANGDSANKIGTYALAVLAKYHNIPIYFAVPKSTIDLNCADGSFIPIEERSELEVKKINGTYICPENMKIKNPSFDITPNSLIAGIITEKGIIYPPFKDGIKKLFKEV